MFDLENKVAVVTGGGRGIGFGIARALAGAGAKVVIANRNVEKGTQAANKIKEDGGQATNLYLDIRDIDVITTMVAKTVKQFQKIDILVNNAGVQMRRSLVETSEEVWDNIINTNLKGLFFCTQKVVPEMTKQKKGKIINITSVRAIHPSPLLHAYCATKAAIVQLTKTMAMDLAKYDINVNAIAPGVIKTDLNVDLWSDPDKSKKMEEKIALSYFGTPDDLGGLAVFLASSASDYITGETIFADGGFF